MKIRIGIVLVIALVLSGCGAAKTATPVAVVSATPVASVEASPTQAPSPTSQPTEGPSATPPQPTATTAPSDTPTKAPSATTEPTATPTKPPTATPPPPTATKTPSPTATPTWWEVLTLLVGPGNPGRLYAFQHKVGRFPVDPPQVRLLVSDDGGQTWLPFTGGLPAEECLHNVNLDYAKVDGLYASTCQGLYRWSGGGWELISAQETTMVAIVYGQPQIVWGVQDASKGAVVIRSNDGGVTWTPAATNLVHFNGVAILGIDPTNANREYAIINPKYAGSYLRRGDASGVWETMPTPNNNTVIDPGMAIDGPSGNLYVTTFVPTYQLWRSTNPGADLAQIQWEMLHDFGPDVWAHLLAAGPGSNGPSLYANITAIKQLGGSSIEVGPAILQRSVDLGKTWTVVPVPTGD